MTTVIAERGNMKIIMSKFFGEHEVIRHHIHSLDRSMRWYETLFLHKVGYFTQEQLNVLAERQFSLKQSIMAFRDGMVSHFAREEDILSQYLGNVSLDMKSDHNEILAYLANIELLLDTPDLTLSPEESVAKNNEIVRALGLAYRKSEAHEAKEKALLEDIRYGAQVKPLDFSAA